MRILVQTPRTSTRTRTHTHTKPHQFKPKLCKVLKKKSFIARNTNTAFPSIINIAPVRSQQRCNKTTSGYISPELRYYFEPPFLSVPWSILVSEGKLRLYFKYHKCACQVWKRRSFPVIFICVFCHVLYLCWACNGSYLLQMIYMCTYRR